MTNSAVKTKPAGTRRKSVRAGALAIGQALQRRRDRAVMTVWQVHRCDRIAELRGDDGERLSVSFRDLRRFWGEV